MRGRILLVEDERAQREPLAQFLSSMGHRVDAVATGEEGQQCLDAESYEVLITDLRLPGIDGLELVHHAHNLDEELAVLLTTAYASVDSAVEALRAGAHDYLLKPLILDEVARKVSRLLEHRSLLRENSQLRRALHDRNSVDDMVAQSPGMKEVYGWVERAAQSPQTNVLILGETGTGKEVAAHMVHTRSEHCDEPFLPVNLAAVPDNMVESTLFGHERGAFTGADRRRDGILRAAGKGTVFLDEVGELGLGVQAKLLRALEAHEVQPLGVDRAAPFQARVIAATNNRLEAMVAAGKFREDLYYRLNVLRIIIPPLRERPEDIPPLIHRLLAEHVKSSKRSVPIVTSAAMRALCDHAWRGNVRELKNVLERALILADEGRIDLEQLPVDICESGRDRGLGDALARYERGYIAMVLRLCDGNRERAASELGISQATLYRRLEKLKLKGESPGAAKSAAIQTTSQL